MTGPQQPGWGDEPGQQPGQQPGQPGWGEQQPMNKKDAKAQAAAAKAYSKSQRSWFAKHKILTALGALILLGIIGSAASGGGGDSDSTNAGSSSSDSADAPAADDAPEEPAPAEPAIVTTAAEMIALLEGNALNAKNTYDGKQVTVSGFVGSIDASGKYFALLPEPDAFVITGVQVQTGENFQDQLASFSQGQPVTVTGKIEDVGEIIGYSLKAETIQ